MRLRAIVLVLLTGALTGCIDDDCWGCDEILIIEHPFEAVSRSVVVDVCDGDDCETREVGRGRCHEPDPAEPRGFFICYDDGPRAGVLVVRRFPVFEGRSGGPWDREVSLRVVADDAVILDAAGLPSIERYEACGRECATRRITFPSRAP